MRNMVGSSDMRYDEMFLESEKRRWIQIWEGRGSFSGQT
jgi:hypothetical protein